MLQRRIKWFGAIGLSAVLVWGPACGGDESSLDADAAEVNAKKDPPGLPPGTTVVPLPKFAEKSKTVKIPNDVGFLHGELLGDGDEAIVLLNGGPGLSSTYLTRLHHGLAEKLPGRRVLRFDQRGMGGSTKTTTAQNTIAGHLKDIDAIRNFLGVKKVHVVGQSFGGFMASAYASMNPDKVASLTFVDGVPPVSSTSEFWVQGQAQADKKFAELLAAGILEEGKPDDSPDVASNRGLGAFFGDPHRVGIEATSPSTVFDATVNGDLMKDWEANGAKLVENASKLRLPVLIIGGKVSLFGSHFVDGAASVLKDAKPTVVMIERGGHDMWFDNPEATFAALDTFFEAAAPHGK